MKPVANSFKGKGGTTGLGTSPVLKNSKLLIPSVDKTDKNSRNELRYIAGTRTVAFGPVLFGSPVGTMEPRLVNSLGRIPH
jgi:hypothetical protein